MLFLLFFSCEPDVNIILVLRFLLTHDVFKETGEDTLDCKVALGQFTGQGKSLTGEATWQEKGGCSSGEGESGRKSGFSVGARSQRIGG